MGSAASTIRKHEATCSDNCVRFVQCFAGMSMKTNTARANRVQAWMVRRFFFICFLSHTHRDETLTHIPNRHLMQTETDM